jgi:short-subunit dehydrogenase
VKALILGATSRVAQEIARLLGERGAELFLVGRDARKLQAVCDDLRVRGAARVEAAAADLDAVDRHEALVEEAERALGPLDLAVIAQGGLGEPELYRDSGEALARVLHTNLVAPASLLTAVARRMEARRHGCIVGIGSVAGDRARRANYGYGAAKGGLALVLQGLRARLHPSGVRVVTVKPGWVDTPMTAHLPRNALFARPDRVARRIVAAAEGGGEVVYVPGFWRAVMVAIRLVPEGLYKRLAL